MTSVHDLTAMRPEEVWLWACARAWPRRPDPVDPASLDWTVVVDLAIRNRMQVLIERVLVGSGLRDALPSGPSDALRAAVQTYARSARDMTGLLQRYLPMARDRGIESAVFKGMHLCEKVYRDPEIRPGMDIDLLVRRHQVRDSVVLLEELGLGRFWPSLLEDAYYDRHHLHQQRCTPEHRIWVDIHWALDHPYNCLTIDYDALMDRTRESTLVGAPVRELSASDDLLCLVVHLVKHAVYLPGVLSRPDLARIILADGFLMYFVDIATLLQTHAAEIDWPETWRRARAWGATVSLDASLRVCRDCLATPMPADAVATHVPAGSGVVTRWFMDRLATQKRLELEGRRPGVVASFLFGYNQALVLRPVRLLDLSSFLLPSAEYLERRYGFSSIVQLARHTGGVLVSACRFVLDTVYYTLKRQLRPNRHAPAPDGSGSHEASAP